MVVVVGVGVGVYSIVAVCGRAVEVRPGRLGQAEAGRSRKGGFQGLLFFSPATTVGS